MDPRTILTRGVSTGLRLGRGTADRVVTLAGPPLGRLSDKVVSRMRRPEQRGPTTFTPSKRHDVADPEPTTRSGPSPAVVARNIGPPRPTAKPARPARPKSGPGAKLPPPRASTPQFGHSQGVTLPDPALVVLVGPSGSGKSTWAEGRYRRAEVVSSDALRGVVGSGPHDLDATTDAFDLLERVVSARTGRGLTAVIDTLGTDEDRRRSWLARAREVGLPAVAVVMDTPDAECRRRNSARDRPVPAPTLAGQLKRHRALVPQLELEGWDVVHTVRADEPAAERVVSLETAPAGEERRTSQGLKVVLQVSRFPWGEDPLAWLTGVARAADEAGFAGLSVMDHLIQIPQVDRAWASIPEPWVTLGAVAGLGTGLELGTLVTPVTFRAPGITAKAAATLDVLTGGRAFVGVGAGWWEREHAAYGLDFPAPKQRLDDLERGIETMKALWSAGTKAYDGARVSLPETTCYPRPVGDVPVIVGGTGRRTLRIAATLGDAANVPSARPQLDEHVATLRGHSDTVRITVLDLPTVGTDREDAWTRVERLRGRTAAAAYAERTHAGTAADQRDRWGGLAELGVDTVFLAIADLEGPEDVERIAGLAR